MSKFIKTLIIINGLLIPLIIAIILFQVSKSFFKTPKNNTKGIIVGDDLENAKSDSLALQGLFYDIPVNIYNSENYYLPISALTYNEKKSLRKLIESSNNVGYSTTQPMNVIFLDEEYNVIRTLLNKKAVITDISIRNHYNKKEKIDTNYKHLAFLIGFEDSNNDNKLNKLDNCDLYISNLSGGNLQKVSNNIDIIQFSFINQYSKIRIVFQERNSSIIKEHRKNKFAQYDIGNNTWTEHHGLNDSINKLEKTLIE